MSLNIKIRDKYGSETTIYVNPNMTIGDAKKLFFGDIRTTHLKFNAKYLYNDKTFSDYGIKDGYVILFYYRRNSEEAQHSVYVLLMLRKIIQEL